MLATLGSGCAVSTFGLSDGASPQCQADDDCAPSEGPCKVARCDLVRHECTVLDAEDGVTCSDGFVCTDDDACAAGACVSAAGFGVVQLAQVAAGNGGYSFDGEQGSDDMGRAVAGVGDMNNDGVPDYAVAAPGAGPKLYSNFGRTYVIFGGETTTPSLTDLDSSARGFVIEGAKEGDSVGWSLSQAGDINGDRIADLAVGANPLSLEERVYVILGRPDPKSVAAPTLAAYQGFWIERDLMYGWFGQAIDGAGDLDGDGFDDLLIGAPGIDAEKFRGRIHAFYGGTQYAAGNAPGDVLVGEAEGSQTGMAVAGIGDINGDGAPDFAVGALGKVYVVYGGKQLIGVTLENVAQGTGGFVILGDSIGTSLSGAGDFNNDGYHDLLVGADEKAYLFFGSSDPIPSPRSVDVGLELTGEQQGSAFGGSIAGIGDIDADGFSDIAIAATHYDTPDKMDVGRIYVLFGHEGDQPIRMGDVAAGNGGFAVDGEAALDGSDGHALAPIGDTNNDGFGDFVIGVPGKSPDGKVRAGRAYIVFGGKCR